MADSADEMLEGVQQWIAEVEFIPFMEKAISLIESAGGEVVISELEQRDRRSVGVDADDRSAEGEVVISEQRDRRSVDVDADDREDGVHDDHEDHVQASLRKLKDSAAVAPHIRSSHVQFFDCSTSWTSNCMDNLCTVECDAENKVLLNCLTNSVVVQ